MDTEPPRGLTLVLGKARDGAERVRGELVALVYDELRRVASRLMRRERADHTLSPTAVVHEALDRLAGRDVRQAQVITPRSFGGMSVPEVAAALGVSTVAVERDWRLACGWHVGQLGGDQG